MIKKNHFIFDPHVTVLLTRNIHDYILASKFCNFTVYLKQIELVNQNSGIIYYVSNFCHVFICYMRSKNLKIGPTNG